MRTTVTRKKKYNNNIKKSKKKKKIHAPLPIGYQEWPKTKHQLEQCWLNQEVALRKKHLDEKVLIEAERLKKKNEEKLVNAKKNHHIRRQETDRIIKQRFDI